MLGNRSPALFGAIKALDLFACTRERQKQTRLVGTEASLQRQQERQAILELTQAARTSRERREGRRLTAKVIYLNRKRTYPLLQGGGVTIKPCQLSRDSLGTRRTRAQTAAILVQRLPKLVLQGRDSLAV
jgi:hypothetical protein